MIKNLKINIAVIVCIAFLFRLLFVNIGIISSSNSAQNNSFLKNHLSTLMKKRKKDNDVAVNSYANEYSVIEICEESSDNEDDISKINPFILLQFLYSSFNKVSLKSNALFGFLNYKLSSKKYLAISVLRI